MQLRKGFESKVKKKVIIDEIVLSTLLENITIFNEKKTHFLSKTLEEVMIHITTAGYIHKYIT